MRTKFTGRFSTKEIDAISNGEYSAVYFKREKHILEMEYVEKDVTMQVFNRVPGAVVCGIDESLAVLKLCTGTTAGTRWLDAHTDLKVRALHDGDTSEPWKAVMTITGRASYFAHLESVYLGIIARGTRVATNVRRCVEAANGKEILFFADRFDRWTNQQADGYAAAIGGANGVATDAMASWTSMKATGTNPHALIAIYNGSTVEATLAFARHYPKSRAIALVDFHNNCVRESLECARAFRDKGLKLYGVRLDTSANMIDESIMAGFVEAGITKPSAKLFGGVTTGLVHNVRSALNAEGFNDVKIVVSGGFHPARIKQFEDEKVPVDIYGVGSSLLQGSFDHTADIVLVDGKPMAKTGRQYNPDPRLEDVDWNEI